MGKRVLNDVHGGQVWRDRDKRMSSGNRRVRVLNVTGPLRPTVAYRVFVQGDERGPVLRSRYERFQKAFDLMPSDLPEDGR